jgi:hypothetical protein
MNKLVIQKSVYNGSSRSTSHRRELKRKRTDKQEAPDVPAHDREMDFVEQEDQMGIEIGTNYDSEENDDQTSHSG